jgi:hypothetical protein
MNIKRNKNHFVNYYSITVRIENVARKKPSYSKLCTLYSSSRNQKYYSKCSYCQRHKASKGSHPVYSFVYSVK